MQNFWASLDWLIGTSVSVFLALLGTFARLGHEQAHGVPVTLGRILWLVPLGATFGVIGASIGDILTLWYTIPNVGPALGGTLGLLGPVFFSQLADLGLKWLGSKEPKDDK